ncbi:hypothetical protein CVT26_005103 [Gymnopilus dilepis]|uniref:Uncharacterized protein n=1 Tax=Gymnopilus dilepis TaxID=231916 RepID=A0A409Y070_9AGAR|nr:hypothetical protein CVT26_005103 [Gymnopilus dilepis]
MMGWEAQFRDRCLDLPNHIAYVAITVHLEHEGKPLTMLLAVAKSHTGENLQKSPKAFKLTKSKGNFDVPKTKAGEVLDEAAQTLADLARELDLEDYAKRDMRSGTDDDGLRKYSFAVKISTTILLPAWFRILKAHQPAERMMPCDVSTR